MSVALEPPIVKSTCHDSNLPFRGIFAAVFLFLGSAMFCNASTFLGRGLILCRVIQYPKYSISNLAKCDFFSLTLSPTLLSCKRTFLRCSTCSSNVEHDVTRNQQCMLRQTLNPKRARTCTLEKCQDYYISPLEDVGICTCPKA